MIYKAFFYEKMCEYSFSFDFAFIKIMPKVDFYHI